MVTALVARYRVIFLAPSTLRQMSTSQSRATAWSPGPSPPRLPKDEQDIFDQLQKQSNDGFSTPLAPSSKNSPQPSINSGPASALGATTQVSADASPNAVGQDVRKGDELHPNVRKGAPPEFEGDRNPKTGEQNGPKVEPLRWGGGVDWSYNGRTFKLYCIIHIADFMYRSNRLLI